MKGWDRRAIRKVEALRDLETIKGKDAEIVKSLWNQYSDPTCNFFTHKQRKLVDDLYDKYFDMRGKVKDDRWPTKDRRLRDELFGFIETDAVPAGRLQIAESLADWCRETDADEMTPGRRTLIAEIVDQAKNSGFQKELYEKLKDKYDNGGIITGSPSFVDSVIEQFEVKGYWSDIQQEHIEKILNDNQDPDD